MDNGTILIITFLTPLLILILYFIWLHRRKKRHAAILESDWNDFKNALEMNDISEIVEYGKKLVWNEKLNENQMALMKESINELAEKHSELEDLKNLIYNKWLDWNRDYVGTPHG